MRANDLFNAFEALDAEMVYEAHACSVRRRHISRRPLIAAAIALMLLSVGIVYGIFLSPASAVYLDSRESAAITLNSRGKALSDGYDGMTAREAVAAVTRNMLDSGALDEDENTLIIGAHKLSEEAQAALLDTVQTIFAESRFHGAIICLPCSDQGAKSAVIGLLADAVDDFSVNDLKHLSANDLNLLLHEYGVTEGVVLSGEPSESGYIGKKAAVRRARDNSKLSDANFSATYLPYRGGLVYLVRIVGEDRAEAFFINAASGAIETALRTTPEQLESEIRTEVKNTPPTVEIPTVRSAAADVLPSTSIPTEQPTDAPTSPVETSQPTVSPTAASTASPTVSPTVPTQVPTAEETEPPTESPQEKSLTVNIPYDKLTQLSETGSEQIEGQSISCVAIENRLDPINYQSPFPSSYVSDIPISGRQDSILLLIRSYEDFMSLVNTDSDSGEIGAFGASLLTDYHIDRDFFQENALIVLYYTYDKAYVHAYETDHLGPVNVSGDTAYVRFTQTLNEVAGYITSAMPYIFHTVAAAQVKKSDVENVSNLILIPEVTVEAVDYSRKQKYKTKE